LDANPGLTRPNAIELLKTKRPDLFPEESPDKAALKEAVLAKQEKIKEEVAKLRAAEPHLSFTLAWQLRQERPELFDFAPP
jgi:hypothetical protein